MNLPDMPHQVQADVAARPDPPAASRGSARTPLPTVATTSTVRPRPAAPVVGAATATATASWYDVAAGAGACGKKCAGYAPNTFASRTMAFGTAVRFCVDQRCVVARCTDRGPYVGGRTFDLSRTVFADIAPLGAGTITVSWSIVS